MMSSLMLGERAHSTSAQCIINYDDTVSRHDDVIGRHDDVIDWHDDRVEDWVDF